MYEEKEKKNKNFRTMPLPFEIDNYWTCRQKLSLASYKGPRCLAVFDIVIIDKEGEMRERYACFFIVVLTTFLSFTFVVRTTW